jgi:hypothetical protein
MQSNTKKWGRIIFWGIVVLLLLASFASMYLQPSPIEVARRRCMEAGVPADDLALLGHAQFGHLYTTDEQVEFLVKAKGKEQPRKLRVDLQRRIYFLPWSVVDYRELKEP